MSYKILKIMNLSFPDVERFYFQDPKWRHASYAEQKAHLLQNRFVYFNQFSTHMRELGYDADDLVFNVKPLQSTWAREHNHDFEDANWAYDILLKQIEVIGPDILYLQGSAPLPHYVRRHIKRFCPSVKLVVMFLGSLEPAHVLRDVDLILAGTPSLQQWYASFGIPTHLLYHAFDQSILEHIHPKPGLHDLTYVGSNGVGYGAAHYRRYWTLRNLAEKTPIKMWLSELSQIRDRIRQYPYPPGFEPMQSFDDLYPGRFNPSVFGSAMYQILADSKISINIHTDVVVNEVGNMRMFEITGAGACMLIDHGANLPELFEPDKEVVVYKDAHDCIEKISWLMEHDQTCIDIARAGQARTLKEHNLKNQCERIHDIIRKSL